MLLHFIDDYAVAPVLGNDRSCLSRVTFDAGLPRRIELFPVTLDVARVALAHGEDFTAIAAGTHMLCVELGTAFERRAERVLRAPAMSAPAPAELVESRGGRYASTLGIDLAGPDAGERFKWFLAAVLYGARISETLATRTWRGFAAAGVLAPARIVATGWDGLVVLLDAGGYARYDYKTATKLLAVCEALIRDYGGSLDALHDAAAGPRDLEQRIRALGKGIGDTTAEIFLRELRGIWDKAEPPLSPLAFDAAIALGYLPPGADDPERALAKLRRRWAADGQAAAGFADFEAALVREALRLRRQHAA